MTATRAAIYGRQSSANEASVAQQIERGEQSVRRHGWTVAEHYDDLVSASRFGEHDRPGWDRLRADMAAGQLDVVVIWSVSRADRTMGGLTALLDAARDGGVLLHVSKRDKTYDPADPSDRATLLQQGISAEIESEERSEAVQRAVTDAVAAGRPPMGKVPYGYVRTYAPTTGELMGQVPDPETAPEIERAFELAADGVPINRIAGELGWSRRLVQARLRNPAYAGLRRHRRQGRNGDGTGETHEGDWPAIVSPEQFYAVGRLLDERASASRRPGRQRYLLSGIAVDPAGHPLQSHKAGRFYHCHSHGCVQIERQPLDDLVEAVLVARPWPPTICTRGSARPTRSPTPPCRPPATSWPS